MGNESDKLVFDYLSRIGDLAHSTSMTAAERARLVGGLRSEIDRMRAEKGGAESKAAVKKILDRLGRPEDVVASGGGGTGLTGVPAQPGPLPVESAPGEGSGGGSGSGSRSGSGAGPGAGGGGDGTKVSFRKKISLRKAEPPAVPAAAGDGPNPPHLARPDELGPEESDPDWWRVDSGPHGGGSYGGGPFGGGSEGMPGFTGGIVVPEMLKPPPGEETEDEPKKEAPPDGPRGAVAKLRKMVALAGAAKEKPNPDAGSGAGTGAGAGPGSGSGEKAVSVPRVGGVVEWAAVALLLAGALLGQLLALAAGWLAAWWSPRLSRNEAKWAAAGMPGIVAAGTLVWLWGRTTGKWGEPLAEGGKAMGDALTESGPVVLRVAAVASALCVFALARRPRR